MGKANWKRKKQKKICNNTWDYKEDDRLVRYVVPKLWYGTGVVGNKSYRKFNMVINPFADVQEKLN